MRSPNQRQTPRVVLENPVPASLDDRDCLVIEVGLGGVKIEHDSRAAIASTCELEFSGHTYQGIFRYSIALPSSSGLVFHSGIEFTDLDETGKAKLNEVLVRQAERIVGSWEANVAGRVRPTGGSVARSAVAQRFIWLRLQQRGWEKQFTADPNQPLDGFAVPADTSEEEIGSLCQTYEASDETTRNAMRHMATLVILDRVSHD